MKPLSWSEFNAWVTDRDAWFSRYMEGIRTETNYYMQLGKDIHNSLGTLECEELKLRYTPDDIRNIDRIIKAFKLEFQDSLPYHKLEYKVEVSVSGIPTIGYWDVYNDFHKEIVEIKTGKRLWDWERVCSHEQMLFYTLQARESGVKLERIKLFSASTTNGKCVTHTFRYTEEECKRFLEKLLQNWEEMKPYHELRK